MDTGSRPSAARSANPDLVAIRREAGRKGGLKAQASKQLASSKPEQTVKQNQEQAEQTAEQLAPSKPSNLLPRDPEDQRRSEEEV